MRVLRTALACLDGFGFAVFLPCCFSQVGASLYTWLPQPREDVTPVPCRTMRPAAGRHMDWPAGPSQVASDGTQTLLVAVPAPTFGPCQILIGRDASSKQFAVYRWQVRNDPSQTAPLGAVTSHMSCTPNSESSLLWSPGDDTSEGPPPQPAPPALSAPASAAARIPSGGGDAEGTAFIQWASGWNSLRCLPNSLGETCQRLKEQTQHLAAPR